MPAKQNDYGREIRDTVVKSSLTGVAATVLAVTIFSPAGFGGLIGTSLASGIGSDTNVAPADDPYARLPAFPAPLSQTELETIRGDLARTTASLEITRAATEARIEHIRSIALTPGVVTFAPVREAAALSGLRLRTSEAEAFAAPVAAPAPVEAAAAPAAVTPAAMAPAPVEAMMTPASYTVGPEVSYRDRHAEFATLLLARDSF